MRAGLRAARHHTGRAEQVGIGCGRVSDPQAGGRAAVIHLAAAARSSGQAGQKAAQQRGCIPFVNPPYAGGAANGGNVPARIGKGRRGLHLRRADAGAASAAGLARGLGVPEAGADGAGVVRHQPADEGVARHPPSRVAVTDGAFVVTHQPANGVVARDRTSGVTVADRGTGLAVPHQPANGPASRHGPAGVAVADLASLVVPHQPGDIVGAAHVPCSVAVADGAGVLAHQSAHVVVSHDRSAGMAGADAATVFPQQTTHCGAAGRDVARGVAVADGDASAIVGTRQPADVVGAADRAGGVAGGDGCLILVVPYEPTRVIVGALHDTAGVATHNHRPVVPHQAANVEVARHRPARVAVADGRADVEPHQSANQVTTRYGTAGVAFRDASSRGYPHQTTHGSVARYGSAGVAVVDGEITDTHKAAAEQQARAYTSACMAGADTARVVAQQSTGLFAGGSDTPRGIAVADGAGAAIVTACQASDVIDAAHCTGGVAVANACLVVPHQPADTGTVDARSRNRAAGIRIGDAAKWQELSQQSANVVPASCHSAAGMAVRDAAVDASNQAAHDGAAHDRPAGIAVVDRATVETAHQAAHVGATYDGGTGMAVADVACDGKAHKASYLPATPRHGARDRRVADDAELSSAQQCAHAFVAASDCHIHQMQVDEPGAACTGSKQAHPGTARQVNGEMAHVVVVAIQAAAKLLHRIAHRHEAGLAPHVAGIAATGRAGIDVVGQAVARVKVHRHQLQLVRVVDAGAVFAVQKGPGCALHHHPGRTTAVGGHIHT